MSTRSHLSAQVARKKQGVLKKKAPDRLTRPETAWGRFLSGLRPRSASHPQVSQEGSNASSAIVNQNETRETLTQHGPTTNWKRKGREDKGEAGTHRGRARSEGSRSTPLAWPRTKASQMCRTKILLRRHPVSIAL